MANGGGIEFRMELHAFDGVFSVTQPHDEPIRGLGGDLEGSEDTLMPLLRAQDKPGWRTRAFTLAIAGDTKEAVQ